MKVATFAERLNIALSTRNILAADLARQTGISEGLISGYKHGKFEPKQQKLDSIAQVLNVSIPWLMGGDVPMGYYDGSDILPSNLSPMPPMKKIPLLGEIACGEPILAEENISDYIDVPGHIKADFSLTCKGDSMIDAGIKDGDIVYIRQQPTIENGQIAAVLIDNNEATLKRVYVNKDHIILQSANSAYPPMVYGGNIPVKILGKAVAFIHLIK